MTPLAPRQALAYACSRRLRNAPNSGPALRQRAFFTPGFRPEFVPACLPCRERAGCATREGARCSVWQFLRPARFPAPIIIAGFQFILE